ncbi:hypothetical protein PZC41_14195 [Staphylococcus aureus]|uniref:hypothetical protein n=1 Tax=Staphylococcus aureus TaxID=1280 RepID=UPI0023AFBA54|nr:hypothetical protein [Staphylococcus aureus]MDE8535455.1 hypothetical protein [Staphylococcus aureus]
MAAGDLYELIFEQRFLGQQVLNVFHYEQAATIQPLGGSVEDVLLAEFEEQKIPAFTAVHSTDVSYVSLRCRSLFDASKSAVKLLTGGGGLSSQIDQVLPAFATMSFTLNPAEPIVRKGAKRVAGVLESVQADGILTDASYLVVLNALAEAFETPITGGLIIQDPVWYPVLVKRIKEGVPGEEVYRLPANSQEAQFTRIKEAVLQLLISTQNSRKVGIGA